MKPCPKCLSTNTDDAQFCVACKQPFASAPRRQGTLVEGVPNVPRQTAVEGRGPTRVEQAPLPPPPLPRQPPPAMHPPMQPPPLVMQPPAQPTPPAMPRARQQTQVFHGSPGAQSGAATATPVAATRKIVAVLISFSWDPSGRVYPIREGRNLIGRNADCDIPVPEDPALSGVNTHITFRRGFTIGDMVSMGGTDLNGEPIEEQFRPLENYAKIRTGSTYWTLLIVPESTS